MILTKSRAERELFSHDFSAELAEGETLSVVGELTVRRSGVDVTAQFRIDEPAPVIDGSDVEWWVSAAAAADAQMRGRYRIRLLVSTSQGRVLEATGTDDRLIALIVY